LSFKKFVILPNLYKKRGFSIKIIKVKHNLRQEITMNYKVLTDY